MGLDVSDCSLPAIQFRSEIGMTEQNTNDSRGSVSRTDPAHYNQADTASHQVTQDITQQFGESRYLIISPSPFSLLPIPPFDNIIRDMIQEI